MRPVDPADVVAAYLEAVGRRDYPTARGYLADRDFRYASPIARYDDPDAFVASMEAAGAILARMDTRLCFKDGEQVCHVLDVTVSMAGYETQTVVHLARVRDGRIGRLEVIFDASRYWRMIGAE